MSMLIVIISTNMLYCVIAIKFDKEEKCQFQDVIF